MSNSKVEQLSPFASQEVERMMSQIVLQNPNETEFHQSAREFLESVVPFALHESRYRNLSLLERLVEPDCSVSFRVCWEDDRGRIRTNRGWRVQFSDALGPCGGGLRFHPKVNLSITKFLAFEQTFRNALAGVQIGGGMGSSDFDPKSKSDREVQRFCQTFFLEMAQHIGEFPQLNSGDIGVGEREIGFLSGQLRELGSRERIPIVEQQQGRMLQAGGKGVVFFVEEMLQHHGESLQGKTCSISGSGKLALAVAKKANELGGVVVTLSDSTGFLHDPDGFCEERIESVRQIKQIERGALSRYAKIFPRATFFDNERPWRIPVDVAFACASHNEVSFDDAITLLNNGLCAFVEGANMPTELEAIRLFAKCGILFAPSKAANIGGDAVALSLRSDVGMPPHQIDESIRKIVRSIHSQCVQFGSQDRNQRSSINYIQGANIASFVRVAEAMLASGSY